MRRLLRPERLVLGGTDADGIPATVKQVLDLGGTRRITTEALGREMTVVTLGGGRAPRVGDKVKLSVAPEDVVPLPVEA